MAQRDTAREGGEVLSSGDTQDTKIGGRGGKRGRERGERRMRVGWRREKVSESV